MANQPIKLGDIIRSSKSLFELSGMVDVSAPDTVDKVSPGVFSMLYRGSPYTLVADIAEVGGKKPKYSYFIYAGEGAFGQPVGNIYTTDKPNRSKLNNSDDNWVATSVKLNGVQRDSKGKTPEEVTSYTTLARFKSFWEAVEISLLEN